MDIKFKNIIVIITFLLAIESCSLKNTNFIQYKIKNEENNLKNNELYKNRYKKYKRYLYFINKYNNYYYYKEAKNNIINLYYTYKDYEIENNSILEEIIDQFIESNPRCPYIDFLIYIQGLINMDLDKNTINFFIYKKKFIENTKYAYLALNNFKKLIYKYPNSDFYKSSKNYIFHLNERIAFHELQIIKFYFKKHAYSASNFRILEMINKFPNTKSSKESLIYFKY
ncbi:yfiO [Wigglesworthia glossinidia endosymbiont of Glossina brevipalpis]|uniref:YfiO protein n=1 Tax=Wigglesworthia glossinidia brevipalpis TaxID=36870 RepID=Q8D221_WIGBR|nr:yfiO [Wigglesworthia glossinidia endosymbiont of Glossina brevipalpis]